VSRILVATSNAGKLREFQRLLAPLSAKVLGLADLDLDLVVEEPHDTYRDNAIEKARAYCRASGVLTLADDSGLEAAALDWGPGVRTGRYGGPGASDPVALLLERLRGVADRRARMVCWLALGIPSNDGEPLVETFSGSMDGEIAAERRGDGGFGYDPIFQLPEGMTTAELPESDKDLRSHRGRAVAAAMPRLAELLEIARAGR
jgi:XTP/dITP diphosphohydrolase